MTVSSDLSRKSYNLDGTTTSFDTTPMVFFTSDELSCFIITTATGGVSTLTENTSYTVTGGGTSPAVGTVDLSGGSSPYGAGAAGEQLLILRTVAITQQDDFVNNAINDANVQEAALDRLTMIDQQLERAISRKIGISDTDTMTGFNIPPLATRKGALLGFDATTGEMVATPLTGTSVQVPNLQHVSCAGSANLLTLTSDANAITTYSKGQAVLLQAAYTNTGAVNANRDSVGNLPVEVGGNACVGGEIKAGSYYLLVVADDALSMQIKAVGSDILQPVDGGLAINMQDFANSVSSDGGIPNGTFDAVVNAGPVALTTTASASVVDDWYVFQNTAADGIAARVASDIAGSAYYLKIGRNASSTSTNSILAQVAMRTVDSIPFQGQEVTVSVKLKAGANFSGANVNFALFSGTGTDEGAASMSGWTGVTVPKAVAQVITTTGTRYQITGTIPSDCTEIGIRLYYDPTGTAGADDNLYIADARIDLGAAAKTSVETRPFSQRIQGLRPPVTKCGRLSNYGTGALGTGDPFTQCQFLAYNGNTILIDGVPELIPAGNISSSGGIVANYSSCYVDGVASQALSPNTLYLAGAKMVNGQMVINFTAESNGYTTHPVYGYEVFTNDHSTTLIGLLYPEQFKTTTLTSGGSGYVDGRYYNVSMTGGTGSGLVADITVSGGAVTVISMNEMGTGYTNADVLSAAAADLGGTGSGLQVTLSNIALVTYGGARGQTISGFYNRFRARLVTQIADNTTGTATTATICDDGLAHLSNGQRNYNVLKWVQWFDDAPHVVGHFHLGNSVSGNTVNGAVTLSNGLGVGTSVSGVTGKAIVSGTTNPSVSVTARSQPADATGFYISYAAKWGSAGNTTTGAGDGFMFSENVMV